MPCRKVSGACRALTADDGTAAIDGDGASVHHYTTQYEYMGGVQDRKNREFLGFGRWLEAS
jgi:hypothetical protein